MAFYIARTDGATSGSPIEVRQGTLADIKVADQANWRAVTVNRPTLADGEIRTTPFFTVQGDGSVTMEWNVTNVPVYWLRNELQGYAERVYLKKIEEGIIYNGNPIPTDDGFRTNLFNDYQAMLQAWITTATYKTKDGFTTVNQTQLGNVCEAVVNYRQALTTAFSLLSADIDSDTVTTKAGVDAYAWPSKVVV